MRKLLILGLLIITGCGEQEQVPEDLLDRSTFKSVLTEAQLIEARMNHEMVVEHRREVPMKGYYEEVFKTHGIEREQFERTFEYYTSRPAELREIYEEVITELSRRKDLIPDAQLMDTIATDPQEQIDTTSLVPKEQRPGWMEDTIGGNEAEGLSE